MLKNRVTLTEKYFMQRYKADTLRVAVERAACEEIDSTLFDPYFVVPIDVERIAARRSIRISEETDWLACDEAKLLPEKTGFVVQMRAQSSPLRRRTTLAHEVGHTLFYQDYGGRQRHQIGILDAEEISAEERICNLFARALLMPALCLKESILPVPPHRPFGLLETLDRTSREFEVSLPALILRLSDVRPPAPPYIILCLRLSENLRTNTDAQLRVDSCVGMGPAKNVYIWRNRSARSINLKSVVKLFNAWKERHEADINQAGRFALNDVNELIEATKGFNYDAEEEVNVSIFRDGRWRNNSVPMSVCSRLYAKRNADVRDANIVAVLTPKED